jgi:hypothetical protein
MIGAVVAEPHWALRCSTKHVFMNWSDPITILTGAIAGLALVQAAIYGVQAYIYAGMRADTRSIERAYVDLSHAPPGLQIDPPQGGTQTIHCRIVLKNHGRTPADILAVSLRLFTHTQLHAEPPYAASVPMRYTVMPGETVNWTNPFTLPVAEVQQVQANTRMLWIVGYVDYRDRFGKAHRNGYARRYMAQTGNNLVFEIASDYNYDADLPA